MRIKLINNDKNLGAGKSRNKAIDISNGEYIAFVIVMISGKRLN